MLPWWSWILVGYFGVGLVLSLIAWLRVRRIIRARKQAASQAPRWGFEKGDLGEAQGCLLAGLVLFWPVTAPMFFKKRPDLESTIN